MSDNVWCRFNHIPSKQDGEQLAVNIETFVQPKTFDKKSIKNCGADGNGSVDFSLSRAEADRLRDRLAEVLPDDNSPIWFSMQSDPLHFLIPRSLATSEETRQQGPKFSAVCHFGSLRSYNQFYTHVLLDNQIVSVTLRPERPEPNTLIIEFGETRITIPMESIQKKNILINKEHKNGIQVLLPLKYAPQIYHLETLKNADKNYGNSDKKQHRTCGGGQNPAFVKNIARCSDLFIHFKPSEKTAWLFLSYFLLREPPHYEMNFSTFKVSRGREDINGIEVRNPFPDKTASFQDRYALEMLDSLGYVFRDKWAELSDEQLNWKNWKVEDRYTLCCFAYEQLLKDHGYDLRRTEKEYAETRKKADKSANDINENPVCAQQSELFQVATCTLTPLKLLILPLESTIGNRAMRTPQFGGVERFLLVHFREEDNKRLRVSSNSIKKRLKTSMEEGITLLKKKFKYVGASTGQMKEMGFWFIDLPPSIPDIKAAHNIFGSFDDIKNIATYIARVGQYFSSTRPVGIRLVKVDPKKDVKCTTGAYQVSEIPDIKTADGHCFTDGVGKLSWGLAGRIAQKMNMTLTRKEDIPSAYQVRVAGCKGMVAIDPQSTLNDYYMCVRDSMIKFKSDDWNLEICEYARPITLTFNNQVIRLLSDLKNPDSTFIAFQRQAFSQRQVLEGEQATAIDIAVRKNASYSSSKHNLLTNRIPVPLTDGRNLYGIADETGELEYGQCFIQYSSLNSPDTEQRKFHVVKGDVIVTKNPCLWPGDFRRLRAVSNEKLEECMRDVIVFPTTGKRPHSNEISGSDLDGDQYWVYWGDRLRIEEMKEPLSYTGAEKKKVPSFDPSAIINHIVESFGAGIVLGMIANTHTVVADKHEQHSHSEECKELAELFALAVDSPKTGKFIDKEKLRPYQRDYCRDWPKFMRKPAEPVYDSKSVLEKLYMNAEEKYYQSQETPVADTIPQRKRGNRGAASAAPDPAFQTWLDGGDYPESPNKKKTAGKIRKEEEKPTKKNLERGKNLDSLSSEQTTDRPETPITSTTNPIKAPRKPAKSAATTDDNSNDKSVRKSTPQPDATKGSKDQEKLINSDATASGYSSLTTLSSLNNDRFSPSFLLVTDTNVTAASGVQFSTVGTDLYTVNLKKEPEGAPDRDQIIDKLVKNFSKEAVFKTKSSTYVEAVHGPLYLIIFYGQIQFVKQNPFPQKYGELKEFVGNCDQSVHLEYSKSEELNVENSSSSTTKKNKIEYEFDCFLSSCPSTYMTLLYDNAKTLQQIRVYSKWLKCYVRQPSFTADCLYEIRSVLTHDSSSTQFNTVKTSLFRTDKTDLLSGRKPTIQVNRELLRETVVPISLKVIDDDQATHINQGSVEAFYRKVKDVSINKQQEKIKVIPTIEYHVSPITKDEHLWGQVCDFALSVTEKTSKLSSASGFTRLQPRSFHDSR